MPDTFFLNVLLLSLDSWSFKAQKLNHSKIPDQIVPLTLAWCMSVWPYGEKLKENTIAFPP